MTSGQSRPRKIRIEHSRIYIKNDMEDYVTIHDENQEEWYLIVPKERICENEITYMMVRSDDRYSAVKIGTDNQGRPVEKGRGCFKGQEIIALCHQ